MGIRGMTGNAVTEEDSVKVTPVFQAEGTAQVVLPKKKMAQELPIQETI
jgi:hypothetical protein